MKETIAEYIVPVTQDGKDVMFDFLRATRLTRCKDCRYYEGNLCVNGGYLYAEPRDENWFCADADPEWD